MDALTKKLYDALKTVTPEFEWEGEVEWEAWKVKREEAIHEYEKICPLAPFGYRFLTEGEMMQEGDLFLNHLGEWESVDEFEEWTLSFKPMARKII